MSIFKKLNPKKIFNPKRFNPADQIKDEVNKLKGTLKREIVDEVKKELIKPLEDQVKKIPEELKEGSEKFLQEILQAFVKEAYKGFVVMARRYKDQKLGLRVFLGPLTVHFIIDEKKYALLALLVGNKPTKERLPAILRLLKPEEIDIDKTVNFPGIQFLSIGGGVTFTKENMDMFYKDLKEII